MKQIIKNQGVIIKSKDYKDNSKIITILTKDGLIDLILKGVTSMNSGTKKYTIIPVNVDFLMTSSNHLSTFTEGYVINNYTNIKSDLNLNFICMSILEKVNTFASHIDDMATFYDFVLKIFTLLDNTKYPQIVLNLFEIKLLYLLGIAPILNYCNNCNSNQGLVLSINQGGTICSKCKTRMGYELDENQTQMFKYLYLIKLEKIDEAFFELIVQTNLNLDEFIDRYYEKYIDFHSKTKKIIKKVS